MPDADVRAYYEELAETYDRTRTSPYHRMLEDHEVAVAAPYARGARVLELGCGTGRILARLAPSAREAVGVDHSEAMAARARSLGLDVRIADLADLPFEDDSFDLTCSFKVLPHVRDLSAAVAEAVRVTRPGGHLLLELYNRWSLRFMAKTLAGPQSLPSGRTEADVFTRWDSPRTARAALPSTVRLVGVYGVRVLTPFAGMHARPYVGPLLRRAERLASSSALGRFGGFLVLVVQKR